eukprot:scaffold203435_cov14-Prasinocladus_malaysianus.AAC.1
MTENIGETKLLWTSIQNLPRKADVSNQSHQPSSLVLSHASHRVRQDSSDVRIGHLLSCANSGFSVGDSHERQILLSWHAGINRRYQCACRR